MAEVVSLVLPGLDAEITALVAGKVDLGTLNAAAQVEFLDGTSTVLVTVELDPPPAFSQTSGATYSANSLPKQGTVTVAGSAVLARVLDRDGNAVIQGPCGETGTGRFMELDKLELEPGDIATLTGGTLFTPAGPTA